MSPHAAATGKNTYFTDISPQLLAMLCEIGHAAVVASLPFELTPKSGAEHTALQLVRRQFGNKQGFEVSRRMLTPTTFSSKPTCRWV